MRSCGRSGFHSNARAELVEHRLDVEPALGRIGDAEHRRDAEQPSPFAHDAETRTSGSW